jgi:hypothetical protein
MIWRVNPVFQISQTVNNNHYLFFESNLINPQFNEFMSHRISRPTTFVMFEIGNFGCFQAFNVSNNKISIIISDLVLKNDL